MAYIIDKRDNSLVISGFEKGIADDPFSGIADMRNVNIVSVPGEASVNFATSLSSMGSFSGSIASATGGGTVTYTGATGTPVNGMALVFTGGSLPTGISAGTQSASADTNVYWIGNVDTNLLTFKVYSDFELNTSVVTGNGTGTFASIDMVQPKYFAYDGTNGIYYSIDTNGRVWSSARPWQFTGNITRANGNGNGLVIYKASDGTIYLFAFRNKRIDYTVITIVAWNYGWNPASGTTNQDAMKTSAGTNNPHEAIVAPDNKVYFTDANWVGRFYQADPNVAFVPGTPATYIFDQTQVLPFTDTAQCLAPLGNNILIGGKLNIVYPWDTFSQLPNFPIFIAEYNVVKLVTVNTNTYIFAGNRGRIYYTNGSQAQLYKKIPDHISGTIEPYFTWGGVTSNKNQLYFGVSVTTNGGTATNEYGGLWAIDLDTKALRLSNKLSYGTYAGYPTAIISTFANITNGTGLFAGWDSGASTFGIDASAATPYTGSQATIDSDYIPIGTFDKPREFTRTEYRLTKAMVSGESVTIQYRLLFGKTDQSSPAINTYTTILTDNTVGNYSNSGPVNFKNAQWIQLRAIINSTGTSPSYTRLKDFRLTGING